MSFQQVIIVGNLGSDPELRYLPNGNPTCSLSVAVNEEYTDKSGQKIKKTVWIRASAFGKTAESAAKYLTKGREVLLIGKLRADEKGNPKIWTSQDGTPRSTFEITVDRVQFLGAGNGNGAGQKPAAASNADPMGDDGFGGEEDIPFE